MYVYYCTNCDSIEPQNEEIGNYTCTKCKEVLFPLRTTVDNWNKMSDDEINTYLGGLRHERREVKGEDFCDNSVKEAVSLDKICEILRLNSSLRAEMALLYKYADNYNLIRYDLSDLKRIVNTVIEGFNDNRIKSYGFMKNNLVQILRQINFAETNGPSPVDNISPTGSISFDNVTTGEDFEVFCSELLKRRGYEDVILTPGSGDHGVDILAQRDDVTFAIQCKYYSNPVGNAAIQEVFSGKKLYHKDIAVVMTNSTFTPQAINDAGELGVKLWDGTKIEKWISELQN